jgi:isoleucyl-tRNA synthetase
MLRARGEDERLLSRYRDDLATLFIVSEAELRSAEGEGPDLEVTVTRAEGSKCPRCWRIVPSISSASGMEGLCDRCVDALQGASGTVAG